MNKRTVLAICTALVLGAIFLFIDLYKPPKIQIFWEKSRRSILRGNETPNIFFHFTSTYPLTSIKVVAVDDARTNKYPHSLWHLVATNAPVPRESFGYGQAIPGMKPEIAAAEPEPLDPDTDYLLLVEAGKRLKGKVTFQSAY